MNKPLVSVIIPCYNAEKYVEEAIRSVMTQTYPNLEIILTDDCSSDNTLMILETLAAEDSRIKVIKNEENLKIVKSLNNMIGIAQGKYIARMDADDISLPERIEKQVSFLESNPEYGLCGTNAWHIDESGKKIGKRYLPETNEDIKFFISFYSPIYHPSVFSKAEILKQNLYSEDFPIAEDYELWFRLLFEKKVKFYNIQKFLLKYRITPTQSSKTSIERQIESSKKILEIYNTVHKEVLESHLNLMFNSSALLGIEDINFATKIFREIGKQKYIYSYYVFMKVIYKFLKSKEYFFCIKSCLSPLGFYCCIKKLFG